MTSFYDTPSGDFLGNKMKNMIKCELVADTSEWSGLIEDEWRKLQKRQKA